MGFHLGGQEMSLGNIINLIFTAISGIFFGLAIILIVHVYLQNKNSNINFNMNKQRRKKK